MLIRSSHSYLWSLTLNQKRLSFAIVRITSRFHLWICCFIVLFMGKKNLIRSVLSFIWYRYIRAEQLVYFSCIERILELLLIDIEGHTTKCSTERSVIYNYVTWCEIPLILWSFIKLFFFSTLYNLTLMTLNFLSNLICEWQENI